MFAMALRNVRFQPGRLVSTLLAAFLGAGIVMAFASMFDTRSGPGVDETSGTSLEIAANVVGGYGTLLVFFSVASTMTVNVRQRAPELALLRSAGATPGQVRRMVIGESAVVALVGAALAVVPAWFGGRALLDVFKDTDQVAADVDYVFGTMALSMGFGTTLVAAVGGAFLAVRRATRSAIGRPEQPRTRGRLVTAGVLAVVALGLLAATDTLESDDPLLMAPAGYGAILLSVGLGMLAPTLLRFLTAPARGTLSGMTLRQGADRQSGVFLPLVSFVGMATGTLYIQTVASDTMKAAGVSQTVDDKNIETLNLVVVGIIVVFACVMLINGLYAATSERVREFGQLRLAGATPRQVLVTVFAEGLALTVLGVVLGTGAAVTGILAYSRARTGDLVPELSPALWIVIAAIAVASTLVTTLGTARHVLRVPAVEAASTGA
ncbi:ABC transporter permease [Streptomyces sp. NPDC096205]|uniref:ABC transporter permease n=1 Tax=Streptomyces sp. NPDC096205 TaxID=3366081 RepID=UPI0037FDF6C4